MKIRKIVATATLGLMLSGCAYHVHTMSSPDLDVYSDYTAKVPGHWAIFVGHDNLNEDIHVDGYACSGHSFPMDLRSAFAESAIETFQNLVQSATEVNSPLTLGSLKAQGFTGQIEITPDGLRHHLNMVPGFFSSQADARIELDAGLIATSVQGRLIGTHASGEGEVTEDAGSFCSGDAKALARASERAMKKLLGELGERFANSRRVRSAYSGGKTTASN